jgi:hypothetical protein
LEETAPFRGLTTLPELRCEGEVDNNLNNKKNAYCLSNKMNFCDYKNALGVPGQGPHASRWGRFAKADVVGTIGLGVIAALLSGWIFQSAMKLNMSMWNTVVYWVILLVFWVFVAFVFGILMHWLFCVETELNKMLGLA